MNFESPSRCMTNRVKVRCDAGKESEKQRMCKLCKGEARAEQCQRRLGEGVLSRAAEMGQSESKIKGLNRQEQGQDKTWAQSGLFLCQR